MSEKLNGINISYIIFDEPTQIKLIGSINPTSESLWVKEIEKYLKDKNDETKI